MTSGPGSGVCVMVRDRAEDITKQQKGCFPYSLGKGRGSVGPTESPEVADAEPGVEKKGDIKLWFTGAHDYCSGLFHRNGGLTSLRKTGEKSPLLSSDSSIDIRLCHSGSCGLYWALCNWVKDI